MRMPSDIWEDNTEEQFPSDTETTRGKDSSSPRVLIVSGELSGHRLDYAVSRELDISRARARDLIKKGLVSPGGGRWIKPSSRVENGESYEIDVPPPEKMTLAPEDVAFEVVYADADIIVVDKPAGLVVHPAPGHAYGTLVHGLLYRFSEFGNINGIERPGIVHRLDATTSGLMVVARTGFAQEKLWAQFKTRTVEKNYIFLCHGAPKDARARIDMPIGRDSAGKRMTVREDGRRAVTDYETLWSRGVYTLGRCVIHTGRTHQIRVHMKAIGCPLVGDSLYGPARENPFARARVFLHSWKFSFSHPRNGEKRHFRSFIPDDLRKFLISIR